MIDTDKYEGHTQGPLLHGAWKLGHSGVSPFVHIGELTIHATNDYLQEIDMGDANARLIADAPKLLTEVKRLRGIAKTCLEAIEAGGDIRSGTIELIEHNLKGMIE